jgi:hypothetical protein
MGAIGVLAVIGMAFGVLLGTGHIQRGSQASSDVGSTAPDAYAEPEQEEIRGQLEAIGLSAVPENVIATLSTLEKIDDFPIYTMRYFGPYLRASELVPDLASCEAVPRRASDWACSLFAALGDPGAPVFGRNFDWEYSPILVLLLEPEAGHRSIMSIDIAYLVEEADIGRLDECHARALLPLLDAPFLTFDGMNEHGLAIGMAAVDYACGYPADPEKRDVGDLRVMREVLERATTVDEAMAFLETINPTSQGGPNMHYLIADRTPSAALIEYDNGEMHVFRSSEERPWQLGTNFPVVLTDGSPTGNCWRYDLIEQSLRACDGALSSPDAMELLGRVSTPLTQWSIAYDLTERTMYLSVGRDAETVYRISLETGVATREHTPSSGQ